MSAKSPLRALHDQAWFVCTCAGLIHKARCESWFLRPDRRYDLRPLHLPVAEPDLPDAMRAGLAELQGAVPAVAGLIVPPEGQTREQWLVDFLADLDRLVRLVSMLEGPGGGPDPDTVAALYNTTMERLCRLSAMEGVGRGAGEPTDKLKPFDLTGAPAAVGKAGGKRKRGSYKTPNDRTEDRKVYEHWQAAKRSGVRTIAEYCRGRGESEKKVRAALERHRKREARRNS